MADGVRATAVRSWPTTRGGVLATDPHRIEDLSAYRDSGGYQFLSDASDATDVHAEISDRPAVRRLRGRGGAAFSYSEKVASVRSAAASTGSRPYVVANGAEGEPLSVKDRYLMRHRPHLVLDGIALAAASVGAESAYLYVCDDLSLEILEDAGRVASAHGIRLPDLTFVRAQDTFVAGEASAVVRAIMTRVARPRGDVRRESVEGIDGAPTLLSNVETLARVARAVMPDPCDGESPLLVTLSSRHGESSLVEVPHGLGVVELLDEFRLPTNGAGVLVGGFFGGILPVSPDLRLSVSSMAEHGGGLGCSSLHVIRPGEDPVAVGAAVAQYYADNNARQCRACVLGTDAVSNVLNGAPEDVPVAMASLDRWSDQLVGRGACAVPDGVAIVLSSLLRHYPERVESWLAQRSAGAAAGDVTWDQLTVEVPDPAPPSVTTARSPEPVRLEVLS